MQQQQPIEPTTRLELTLEAQEWNAVIEVLCRSTGFSYVTTAPLIEKLGQQMRDKAEQARGAMARRQQTGVASAA